MSPTWSITDTKTFIREGYRKNALAFRCTEYLASSVGMAVLEAVRVSSAGETVLPERDPLSVLIGRPSLRRPSQAAFFRHMVRLLYVTGEAIYYKVPGEVTGRTVELQNLPSNKIAVKKATDGSRQYEYHFDPGQPPKILEEDEVLFLKFDDLENEDRGLSPLQAAARETDVDNAAADVRKTFFENGTMLQGYLTTEQPAEDKQLRQWSAMWNSRYGGKDKVGKTPALAGGLDYKEVGVSPDKWAFPDLTGLAESRICSAFGLPPILVGAKVGLDRATYANYKEARSAAWEDTVTPLLNFIAEGSTASLIVPGTRRKLRWNTDDVPALQEDADEREQRAGRGVARGTITVNEYREAVGEDPVPDGDVYMIPSNVTIVKAGELDVDRTPEQLQDPGSQDQGDTGSQDQGDNNDPQTNQDDSQAQNRALLPASHGLSTNGTTERKPDASEGRIVHERAVKGATTAVKGRLPAHVRAEGMESLERRLARAIESVFGIQAEAVSEKVLETLDPTNLIDLTVEAVRMAEAVASHFAAILKRGGEAAFLDVDPEEGEFDDGDGEVLDYLDAAPLRLGFDMAQRTREIVREEIEAVQEEKPDATTEEIAKRLRSIIKDRDRANLAAETETNRTSNRAARIAYRQAGITRLVWRVTSENPCEFCRALDGKTISIDEPFAQLGDELEGEDGGTKTISYETLHTPPLHPRDGCYVEYELG